MNNFEFINDLNKIEKLKNANSILGLDNLETSHNHNNIIFVYSVPKVGSTSLVSSLRLFAFFGFAIIHIHDETMLEILTNIQDISIVEIINYNGFLKRNVYVIDIYRSPIEHKISTYFEKISSFHFNTSDEQVNTYKTDKLILRFNNIFPYIAVGDIFMDQYEIDKISSFNYEDKYFLYTNNNITYLKLRLKDVNEWRKIILKVIHIDVVIVNDYSANKKEIKPSLMSFKQQYKIPKNYIEMIQNCKYFNYYYSEKEKRDYLNQWKNKIDETNFHCMSSDDYKLYVSISLENQIKNNIDYTHYMYNGCTCKGCLFKRQNIITRLLNGENVSEKINHEKANDELNYTIKMNKIKKLNYLIKKVNDDNNLKKKNIKKPFLHLPY